MKQAKILGARVAVKTDPSKEDGASWTTEKHRLRNEGGVLIIEELDGTEVMRVAKGEWGENKSGITCVKCSTKLKSPGIGIPCC